jgi:hypothetical protein
MLLEISYLFESFEKGLKDKFVVKRPPITSLFNNFYRQFVRLHGNENALKQFDDTIKSRASILKNAQNGWLSNAELGFQQLKDSYTNYQWCEPILLLAKSQDFPLLAFLEYQKKEFTKANDSLDRAIQTDWVLENQFNFKEIIFHRIHLLHNQTKILIQEKNLALSAQKIVNLLSQLAEPELILFEPPLVLENNSISEEYISLLFHHLCDTLTIICKESEEVFLKITSQSDTLEKTENSFANSLKSIIAFSKDRSIKNQAVDQILKSGNFYCAGFWYFAIAVLHRFCEENEPFYANEIIRNLTVKKTPAYWIQFVKSAK